MVAPRNLVRVLGGMAMAVNADRLQKGRGIGGFMVVLLGVRVGCWCWVLGVGLSIEVDWPLSVRRWSSQVLVLVEGS